MYEKIKEIEIIGEGWQLIRLACKKYRLTKAGILARYAKKTGNYEKSIGSYFDNKIITIAKFKEFLEKDLGKPYEELVQTVDSQLKTYIEGVRDNIYLYNDGADITLLNQLIEEAKYYKMPYLEVVAMGNLGRFKANLRLYNESKVILSETIERAKELEYWDLVLYYHTNIAYVENLEGNHQEARKRLRKLEYFPEEHFIESNMALHRYWYIYAYTMMKIGEGLYSSARKKFEKAMEYAETIDNEVKCLVNIAWLYTNEGKYNKVVETYEKALKVCNRNFHLKVSVLNNMANFYNDNGDIDKAKEYINKAINIMPKNLNINRKFTIFDTYLSIEGDYDRIIEEILQSLRETFKIAENRKYVYSCINDIIEKLRKGQRYEDLLRLRVILVDQIKKEVEGGDQKELRTRIGDIGLILTEEGGYRYEKEISSNTNSDSSD